MKSEKKFICVRCPMGCEIQTTIDGYEIVNIQGNVCKLGKEYVKDEITDPKRIITTTVKVKNGKSQLVPVWTDKPVHKDKIFDLMKILREIELDAPVNIDDLIIDNVLNTETKILASGKVERKDLK